MAASASAELHRSCRPSSQLPVAAAIACSRSEKGCTSPLIYWPVSWPLPAMISTSPVLQVRHGGADGFGAVADLARALGGGQDLVLRMVAGSSLRGLSSVTITSSASLTATAPISGALALVTVAAAAEHDMQLCRRYAAAVPPGLFPGCRGMGVIDIDRRAL